MDLAFSPAELAFQGEVRAFLDAELTPAMRAGAAATTGVFAEPEVAMPWQRALHAKGWLAYDWPVEHGGTGWSPAQRYIFQRECALAGAPALSVLGLKLLGPVVHTFGTAEQKARLLPRVLSGEDYWCQGFSEPGSGSDLASLATRARRDGQGWRVSGAKLWQTHAHHANRMFTLARTGGEGRGAISFLLLDLDQPGVEVRPIPTLAGDIEVNAVFLDEAFAPACDLIGEEGQGWAIAKFLLENERGGSCYAPRLLANLDAVAPLAAADPDLRRRHAKLRLRAEALEMIELRILADLAHGRAPGPQTSVTKLIASTLRQEVDLLALDIHGPAGLTLRTNGSPLPSDAALAAPRYLNSRAWTIFGGTNEVQMNIIAKTVLGL